MTFSKIYNVFRITFPIFIAVVLNINYTFWIGQGTTWKVSAGATVFTALSLLGFNRLFYYGALQTGKPASTIPISLKTLYLFTFLYAILNLVAGQNQISEDLSGYCQTISLGFFLGGVIGLLDWYKVLRLLPT